MQSAYPLTRHFTKLVNTSTECLPRVVVTETVNVPLEIWMTFTFTLVIAAFLVGGGIYLVYHGATNNVTDFMVLGSCGSFVGFCFCSVALIILYKSICGSRKQTSWKNTMTLVPRKQNSMSYKAEPPSIKLKLEITNHVTSNGNCIEASKRKPGAIISANNTAADTMKAALSCDTTNSNQPVILIHTDDRKESSSMERNSLLFNQETVNREESSPDQIRPRYLDLPRHTSMASLSSQSTFSGMSSDSVQTFEETVTVVVAEVHAQPSHTRDSYEYIDEMYLDGQPIHLSSPHISLSVSCEENMFESLDDLSSDDNSSRPNSGVRELMSEEEIPFAYYGEDIIYRLNTSDTENCEDSIATLLINDPLIYAHTSDARNGYVLHKCHMITEVLVHSG